MCQLVTPVIRKNVVDETLIVYQGRSSSSSPKATSRQMITVIEDMFRKKNMKKC